MNAADWLQGELDAGHSMSPKKQSKVVLSEFQRRAASLLARALNRGIYDVSTNWSKVDFSYPRTLSVNMYAGGGLSTFDFAYLTRFVILAHDECIRVSIEPSNYRHLRITLTERRRDGDWSAMHPTMEQAIHAFRGTEPAP